MTTKLSMGVEPISGDIKIGRAKELCAGVWQFTGQTEVVTERAFQCVVESCHITKTTEYKGSIYGRRFVLTYREEEEPGEVKE